MQFDRIISTTDASTLNVYLSLGSTCNFDCTYCPKQVHDGRYPWQPFDRLMPLLECIRDAYGWKRNRIYNLLGGEPTVWPRLRELCQRIKAMDARSTVVLATNGSRTPRYWHEIGPYIDQTIVSVHVSQIDIQQLNLGFKELVMAGTHVNVSILADINHWDKAVSDLLWMERHGWAHYLTLKPVETMLGSNELQPYSEDQLAFLSSWDFTRQISREAACHDLAPVRDLLPTDIFRFALGDEVSPLNNTQAVSSGWDAATTGWHCFIAHDKISVMNDGEVKHGDTCDQHLPLGNFLTEDPRSWDWQISKTICRRNRCVCGGDLDTHKFRDAPAAARYQNKLNRMMPSAP